MILAACVVLTATAGLSSPASGQRRLPSFEQGRSQPDEQELKRQRDQAKKLNEERQEALKRDTERLLQLSTELKEYVDKSNENMLSVDVVKKAEQIEKLAHSVKEKMKGGF